MAVQLLRRSFTIEEYHRMGEAGILREDDRVELIDGEIVEMTPIGSRHAACVDRLTQRLIGQLRGRAIVRVQSPIRLDAHSEPQPDLALLRPQPDFYAHEHPGPADILLIVEVAETSGAYDREVKLPMYARASISEMWLVNLSEERIEIYRQPSSQGYRTVRILQRGDLLAPLAFPDVELTVEALLA